MKKFELFKLSYKTKLLILNMRFTILTMTKIDLILTFIKYYRIKRFFLAND